MTAQIESVALAPTSPADLLPYAAREDLSRLFPPPLGPTDLDLDLAPLDVVPLDLAAADLLPLDLDLRLSDAELVAVMAQEDTAALEAAFVAADDKGPGRDDADLRAFMRAHEAQVRRLLGRYLRRPQDMDEAAQDVFLKMWRCWDERKTPDQRRLLLFRITRHTAFDLLRSRAYREYEKTVFDAVDDDATPALDADPHAHVVRAERVAEVRAALADLPPQQRDLLIARWYHGVPFAELAVRYGTSERALITQQTRLFRKLRLRLAQASLLPLARSEWLQRLRALLSLPEVTHTAMIGILVTSLAAARPASAPLDVRGRGTLASYAVEWQRPVLARRDATDARSPRRTAPPRKVAAAPAAAAPLAPPSEARPAPDAPRLPIPTPPDVKVVPCGDGAAGDAITVEIAPLDVRTCRKQNVVEVCPIVPPDVPGATCRTHGEPSYLVPLPRPSAGIP